MGGVIGDDEDGGGSARVVRDVPLEVPLVDVGVSATGFGSLLPERVEGADDGEATNGAMSILDVDWAVRAAGMEVMVQLVVVVVDAAPREIVPDV